MSSVNLVASYPIPAKNTLTIDEFKKEVDKYCNFVERYLKSPAFLSLSAQQKKQVLARLLKTADQLRGKVSNWRMLFSSGQFLFANGKLIQTVAVLNNLIEKNTPTRKSSRYHGTVFVPIGFLQGCTPYSISCEDTILPPLVGSSVTLKDGKVLFSTQLPQMPEIVKDIKIRLEIFQKKDGKEIKVAEAEGQKNQEIKNLAATGNISLAPGTKAAFIFKTYAVDPNCPKPVQGNPIEVVLQIPGDTTPPAQVSEEKAEAVTADFTQMRVAWKNPADPDLKRVIVLRGKMEDIEKINAFVLTPKMLETIEKNVGGVQIAEGVFAAYATPLNEKETPSAQKDMTISGLQANTEYVFRFFTVDTSGNINSTSKVVTGKTAVDANVAYRPKMIENPRVEKVTENSAQLAWANPSNDPNFKQTIILRGKSAEEMSSIKLDDGTKYTSGYVFKNAQGQEIATIVYIGNEQNFLDTSLKANLAYRYSFRTMSESDPSKTVRYNNTQSVVSAETLPAAVSGLNVTERKERSLTIAWQLDSYNGFQETVVYYSKTPITLDDIKNNRVTDKLSTKGNSEVINGLEPLTKYYIVVLTTAKNEKGETVPSAIQPIEGTTLDDTTGPNAVKLKNVSTGEYEIGLSWDLPTGEEVTSVKVFYSETASIQSAADLSRPDVKEACSGSKITSCKIDNRKPGKKYFWAIFPYDKANNLGQITNGESTTKELEPVTNVASFAGENWIELKWQNPNQPYYGKVKVYRSENPLQSEADLTGLKPIAEADISSHRSINLSPGKKYYFALVMVDNKANEAKPVFIDMTTSSDKTPPAPIDPAKVQVARQERGLVITWQNPTDPDFAGVEIFIREKASGMIIGVPYSASKTEITLRVSGLIPNTEYEIVFKTFDDKKNIGQPMAVATSTLADTTSPAPVTSLTVKLESTKIDATVSWTAPTDGKSYVVVWSANPFTEADLSIQNGKTYNAGDNVSSAKAVTVGAVTQNLTAVLSNLPAEKDIYIMVIPADEYNNYCLSGNKVEKIRTEDIVAPSQVSSFSAKSLPKGNAIELSWISSVSPDLAPTGTYVVFASKDAAQLPSQADLAKGTVLKVGDAIGGKAAKVVFIGDKAANSFEHSGLGDDETWNYAVFVKDAAGNYSVASTSTAKTYGAAAVQNIDLAKGTLSGVYLDTGKLTLKYFEPVAGPNTICLWSMEQNSILNNSNPICNGTISGNTIYVDGLPGSNRKVLSFVTPGLCVDIPYNSGLKPNSFSVSTWFYTTVQNNNMMLVTDIAQAGDNDYRGWNFFINNVLLQAQLISSFGNYILTSVSPPINNWTHVAFSFDKQTKVMRFFVNGKEMGKIDNNIDYSYPSINTGMVIGCHPIMGAPFIGRIAGIHFESKARSSFDMYEKNGSFTGILDLKTEKNTLGSGAILSWTATGIIAGKTNIKVQIRTADTQQALANAEWGGLDAQGNYLKGGYYTVSGSVIKLAPGAKKTVMEVRMIFEGDGVEKPILEKVWIENLRVLNP